MLKGCLIAAASVAVLLVVAIVMALILFSRQPDISREMTPVNISVQAAQSLDDKVDNLERSLASAPSGTTLTIELTQDEVTSKADILLKTSSARIPVRDVVFNFHDGLIEAGGILNMGGGDRTFLAEAAVQAQDGTLGVAVKSVRIGALPVPPGLIEGFLPSFAPGADLDHIPLPQDLGLDVTGITFKEGIAIVEAKAR